MGHLECQFQSVLRICRGVYVVNELTCSPRKFHVSLKQQISFGKLWHTVQSAEKPEGLHGIGSFCVLDKISEVPANVSEGALCWVP